MGFENRRRKHVTLTFAFVRSRHTTVASRWAANQRLCSATGRRVSANAGIIYAKFIHAMAKCKMLNTKYKGERELRLHSSRRYERAADWKNQDGALCNLSNCSACYFPLSIGVIIHEYYTFLSIAFLPLLWYPYF